MEVEYKNNEKFADYGISYTSLTMLHQVRSDIMFLFL
jgi:hypothetical protein